MWGRLLHVKTPETKYWIKPINIYELKCIFKCSIMYKVLRQYRVIANSDTFMMDFGRFMYRIMIRRMQFLSRFINKTQIQHIILISCSDLQHDVLFFIQAYRSQLCLGPDFVQFQRRWNFVKKEM